MHASVGLAKISAITFFLTTNPALAESFAKPLGLGCTSVDCASDIPSRTLELAVPPPPPCPDRKTAQPDPIAPQQLGRVKQIVEKVTSPDQVLMFLQDTMGECIPPGSIPSDRQSTRKALEASLAKGFNKLTAEQRRHFIKPGDSSNGARDRFINIGILARSMIGEIMYKSSCGPAYGKAAVKVTMNRVAMINRKMTIGRSAWQHMLKNEQNVYPQAPPPASTAIRDVLFAKDQYDVWRPTDNTRNKALCPAQAPGQEQTLTEGELKSAKAREAVRLKEAIKKLNDFKTNYPTTKPPADLVNNSRPRKVEGFTELPIGANIAWMDTLEMAFNSQMNPEQFNAETASIKPDVLFYASGEDRYQNWLALPDRYTPFYGASVDTTNLTDHRCLSLWTPAPMPPPKK